VPNGSSERLAASGMACRAPTAEKAGRPPEGGRYKVNEPARRRRYEKPRQRRRPEASGTKAKERGREDSQVLEAGAAWDGGTGRIACATKGNGKGERAGKMPALQQRRQRQNGRRNSAVMRLSVGPNRQCSRRLRQNLPV
jgi:hypothetical protein